MTRQEFNSKDFEEVMEQRLKDINNFEVWKIIDNKGLWNEEVCYMLNTKDGDNINCFSNIKDCKKFAREY